MGQSKKDRTRRAKGLVIHWRGEPTLEADSNNRKGLGFTVFNSSLFKRFIIAQSKFTNSFPKVSFHFL